MSSQTTSTVFMVKPVCFGFNEQTAGNNAFQKEGFEKGAQEKGLAESNEFVDLLKSNDINVVVAEDTLEPKTPDSVFPNNWFSTHETGEFVLYPRFAPKRRAERKGVFIDDLKNFNLEKNCRFNKLGTKRKIFRRYRKYGIRSCCKNCLCL